MIPARYLEVQFIKHIRKRYVTNAELVPQGADALVPYMSSGEHCIVTVRDKQRRQLWFTNRRLLLQEQSRVTTLFEYQAVKQDHWMSKHFWDRVRSDAAESAAYFFILDQRPFGVAKRETKTRRSALRSACSKGET